MKTGSVVLVALLISCASLLLKSSACREKGPGHTLVLKWYKAYPSQQWTDVQTGMKWSFSFLGAMLPQGCWKKAVARTDSSTIQLRYDQLGFSGEALAALEVICDSIRNTREYRQQQGIDLSRFFVLTLHSSWHYYRITGAELSFQDFIKKYQLQQVQEFGVTNSCVADHHRVIRFNEPDSILETAFYAIETHDSLQGNVYREEAYETMSFLPNGQMRFAVYGKNGKLLPASPAALGKAGKPSKCLWCHETTISPLFFDNTAVEMMLSNETFEQKRSAAQEKLERYRTRLKTEIDYSKKQDHTFSELLYISFMEPSLVRIAAEWNMDTLAVKRRMVKMKTHVYEEFPYLGQSYYRYYIDSLAGTGNLTVPLSVREPVGAEPDYFRKNKRQ